MDNIQFWLYILFAVIYFVVRGLRKKTTDSPKGPSQPTQSQNRPQRKPVSFEELLKEFTEGREATSAPKQEEEVSYQSLQELREEKKEEEIEEGRTRRFSDDESRRVYEESILMAEGADLKFERDEHFKSKIQRSAEEESSPGLAGEIKNMLRDQEDVKKAVILGEILNRKY